MLFEFESVAFFVIVLRILFNGLISIVWSHSLLSSDLIRLPVVVVGEVTLPGPLDLFLPVGEVGEANPGDDFARVGEEEKLGGKS